MIRSKAPTDTRMLSVRLGDVVGAGRILATLASVLGSAADDAFSGACGLPTARVCSAAMRS